MSFPEVWYPQCWVRLQIRPETFTATPPLPESLQSSGQDPVAQAAAGFVGLDQVIIPTHCSVTLNSYRKADEAVIEIPAGIFPLDPRVVRMMTVQIYVGVLDPKTYADSLGALGKAAEPVLLPEADPLTGESHEVFRGFADDVSVSYDGDDSVTIHARDLTAPIVDAEMPISGLRGIPKTMPIDQVIQQILLGEPGAIAAPPDNPIDRQKRVNARGAARRLKSQLSAVTKRLAKAGTAVPPDAAEVARLTARQTELTTKLAVAEGVAGAADAVPLLYQRLGLPGARGIVVVNETGVVPLPPLAAVKGATWYDSLGTAKKGRRGAGGSGQKISYWDFITDLVVGAGFICYIRLPKLAVAGVLPPAELVIALPRTYYAQAEPEVRQFIYGFNVDRLEISRNYTGRNIPTGVVVSAFTAETGQPISAVWPPDALKARSNRPSGNAAGTGDRTELTTINLNDRIPATTAQIILTTIAESLYQQIARGELEVTVETTALSTLPSNAGKAEVADMLKLRPADPIEVTILPEDLTGTQPLVTEAGKLRKLDPATKAQILIERGGYPAALAQQLALLEEHPLVQAIYRVTESTIEFDLEDGFRFEVHAINYLSARAALDGQA